jgi:hypothetical protein
VAWFANLPSKSLELSKFVVAVAGRTVSLPRLFGFGEYLPVTSCVTVPELGTSSSCVSENVEPGVPAPVSLPMLQLNVFPLAAQSEEEEFRNVPAEALSVTTTLLTLFPPMFVTVRTQPVVPFAFGFTVPG